MIIKDVIKLCGALLNLDNVVDYANDKTKVSGDAVELTDKLITLTELVLNEMAVNTFNVYRVDSKPVPANKVVATSLVAVPINVLSVKDKYYKELEFTYDGVNIISDGLISTITYTYYPKKLKLETTLSFLEKWVTEELIAMGVVAEYLLSIYDFDSALFWHSRFVDNIKKNVRATNAVIKKRSWV